MRMSFKHKQHSMNYIKFANDSKCVRHGPDRLSCVYYDETKVTRVRQRAEGVIKATILFRRRRTRMAVVPNQTQMCQIAQVPHAFLRRTRRARMSAEAGVHSLAEMLKAGEPAAFQCCLHAYANRMLPGAS